MASRTVAYDLPSHTFFAGDCRDTTECAGSEWGNGGLHPNLDSLKRTQGDVGDELGRSTSGEVESGFVAMSSFLSGQVGVELLEKFITAIFESTLRLR